MANDEFNNMMDEYVSKKRKSDSISFSGKINKIFGQKKEKKVIVNQPDNSEYIDVTDENFKNPEIEQQKSFLETFFGKFLELFSSKTKDEIREEDIEDISYNEQEEIKEGEVPEAECNEVAVVHSDGFFTRIIRKISCIFKKDETKEEQPELEHETEEIKELDEDVIEVLNIVNELFKKLPQDVKEEFKNSEDFETYARVLKKYHVIKKK